MKAGVIKLGSRISYGGRDTSGGNGEVRSIIKILVEAGIDVTVFTKVLAKDQLVDDIQIRDIETACNPFTMGLFDPSWGQDVLLVVNGNVNFFGGAEDRAQLLNYHIINNFKGPVYYLLCDPALQLKQVWSSVSKKPWASNYEEKDINITRDDIQYISQPYRVDLLIDILKKNDITIKHAIHYPFEKFPCLNEIIPACELSEITADLSYGGTMRGGKREQKMINFYWGYAENIDVEMFGKIEHSDFTPKKIGNLRAPRFSGTVKYDDFLIKMNRCLSTVVIGDPLYEKLEDINQRLYECVWSNVITFVDNEFDSKRRAFGHDKDLADFLYVKNRKEVTDRINVIKADNTLRQSILESQIKAINFDRHKYSHNLRSIIEEGIK